MTPRARAARLVVPLVLSLLAACGSDPAEEPVSPPAPPASVPALPDGTVPWLDLPVEQDAFDAATPQRRAVPKGAKACRADQLTASMPKWFQKGDGYEAEGIRPDMALGMFGVVEVRNRSSAACTLQGEVPVRLLVEGRPAAVRSDHGINEEAERRVTAVPPGEGATLRVDWSAPFCGEAAGRQELELTLPDDGGTLLAAVAEPAHPVCSSSETHPELRSVLSSSAFDELRLPSTRAAGFDPLRVTAEAPKEAASGRDLRYVVTLENPTDADIRLDPCPGYAEERFSTGDATVQAVNERSTYRLNCRTVAAVPAHGSVRFEMRSRVPAIEAGRSLAVAWRLLAPGYGSDGTGFTLTVR